MLWTYLVDVEVLGNDQIESLSQRKKEKDGLNGYIAPEWFGQFQRGIHDGWWTTVWHEGDTMIDAIEWVFSVYFEVNW